ncbi:polysaccharide deacetylase family protein [Marinicella rhabdoformis]|uniref:polysaccharide deacetylase family protein n=1 Tax=Marinicella rhabdoformis TaxID=2580566 RepID=UPI0012AEC6CF|nr:polysaccharide deacetylase family protein [Marinicella rhabdoformis]
MNRFLMLLLLGLLWFQSPLAKKQIALTFDDAPRPDTSLSGKERTDKMLAALKGVGVDQVMYFVSTKHVNEKTKRRLDEYQKAGHVIGNHSDQHTWLNKTDLKAYQEDLMKADKILRPYDNFKPYFRFPYLDEGRDEEKSQGMIDFLKKQGYQNGYVTVDNYDWYLDSLYQQAVKANLAIDMEKLKALYVDVLFEAISFSDGIAMQYLGRSPKHVLLLHDNDLAAYFIDDLVLHLEANGWEIISPLDAFKDPIAQQEPKTLFKGQGRVAALARDAGAKRKDLVHVAEDEVKLKQLFDQYQVTSEKPTAMPAWFIEEMNSQIGTWKTSNAKYKSEKEPFTHYMLEWSWGIGKDNVTGRLFAMHDGKATGDFWHFKQYWDANKKQARLLQMGHGGMVGDGFIQPLKMMNGTFQLETIQTFASPTVAAALERHMNVMTDEGLVTTSYRKDVKGEWEEQRSYLWKKATVLESEE